MLLSMIVASSMTAFIATALTLSQISGPQLSTVTDLKGRQVAVIAGTTGERLASKHGARIHSVYTLDDAVSLVRSNQAAAIVFDRPTLRYYLTQHPSVALQLSEASDEPRGYGFVLSKQAHVLRDRLDVSLLQLAAEGQIDLLAEKWLGGGQ